ncbi:MAG: DUF1003 domain-containing protein [Rhodoblastus sp.]|uniref:DUF1003 domain-containing protein n=1 Tax=Rhodoblastus sp. TaxID=1962975 RepID=UPI003F99F4CE
MVIVAWIGLNVLFASLGHHMIDSSPFPWIGEAISLTSLYRVVLVLISQKREDQLAHHREMLILELAILRDIHDRVDPEAETMGQAADTQSVLNAVTKKPASRPQNRVWGWNERRLFSVLKAFRPRPRRPSRTGRNDCRKETKC